MRTRKEEIPNVFYRTANYLNRFNPYKKRTSQSQKTQILGGNDEFDDFVMVDSGKYLEYEQYISSKEKIQNIEELKSDSGYVYQLFKTINSSTQSVDNDEKNRICSEFNQVVINFIKDHLESKIIPEYDALNQAIINI